MPDQTEEAAEAAAYHERTKHRLHRYAAALGYLDWASQPDPFRTFAGAPATRLPLAGAELDAPYDALYEPGQIAPRPVARPAIGAFLELALGLSAWKRAGDVRWALRCNPSSGNLHPTEGYMVTRGAEGVPDGVHHYVSRDHLLEHRCAAALRLPPGAFLLGLSSVLWREAWKYGERAFRYCQHDLGHAIASARYAAAVLGWSAVLLDAPSDDDLAAVLGLERPLDFAGAEREYPEALLLVGPPPLVPSEVDADALTAACAAGKWRGQANCLSREHHPWPVIDAAARACAKPRTEAGSAWSGALPPCAVPGALWALGADPRAVQIIRQRRSALGFDGRSGLTAAAFFRMLGRLAPRERTPPWDALTGAPRVHPAFLVHRVAGLGPGVYVMPRDPAITPRLRAELSPEFRWARVAGTPEGVELYLLQVGDAREAARTLSCHQDIAADGAFTLGMLAEFEAPMREGGAWWYRRLFWEAGVLGHVLYLEAEALGARGTGIGCYFDDLFHGVLGLKGHTFQSLYHFTVGNPVEDPRLQTEPPYHHLAPLA